MFISAEVCADLRHGAVRDLRAALRAQAHVAADTVAAVELMDAVGAAWENKRVADVAADVATLDSPSFPPVEWESMTAPAAAKQLEISQQAARGLLARGTLHGAKSPRGWRVCAEDVAARVGGTKCQHERGHYS